MTWTVLAAIILLNVVVVAVAAVYFMQRVHPQPTPRRGVLDDERPAHYVKLTASERKRAHERNAARRARRRARLAEQG